VNQNSSNFTYEELESTLELAAKWEMEKCRKGALETLAEKLTRDLRDGPRAAQCVYVGKATRRSKLLYFGYLILALRHHKEDLTEEEERLLGFHDSVKIREIQIERCRSEIDQTLYDIIYQVKRRFKTALSDAGMSDLDLLCTDWK
jgi:hypothetical protein